jgi:PAS domain S-box-containing protein
MHEENYSKLSNILRTVVAVRPDWYSLTLHDSQNQLLFYKSTATAALDETAQNQPAEKISTDPILIIDTLHEYKKEAITSFADQLPQADTHQSPLPVLHLLESQVIHGDRQYGVLKAEIIPETSVSAEHRRWEGLFFTYFLIFLAVCWIFFEQYINKPLLRLVRATWALASGDYKIKLPKPRNDEMGSMITSFRMMREAIQKRESEMMATTERMQSIFDRAVDGIFLTDHTGLVETMNRSSLRMFGCDKGQGEGENIDGFIPGIRERLDRGEFQVRDDSEEGEGEYPVISVEGRKRDGSPISIELGVSRLMQGNKVKYLGIFRDVTKRMEMEFQLTEYTSELEAKNVLLDSALEDIRSVSRAKTEFLAHISDEFRTPLNGVLGVLTLLEQDESLNESQRERLASAINSGNGLIAVMNDVLDFSKIESGKIDFENIEFDLRRVIEDLCKIYEQMGINKPVSFSSMISASVPNLVMGDPTRFRQILNNLLSNAVKYTEKGEIIVRCEKVADDQDEMIFEIQVMDTGRGIPEEILHLVRKNLTQKVDAESNQHTGSGLGLNICKRLVDMFNGEMGVDSEEGKGSTFWFTIRSKMPETQLPVFIPLDDISGLHVLCVDDNPTSLEIMERILEIRGVICSTVKSAEHGLKELRQAMVEGKGFDLAIIDRVMPGMDGIEMARQIREDPILSSIKLVLLTSVSVRGDGQLAREAGFNGYFTKPITQGQLYDCISTVMGIREGSTDLLVTRHTLQEHDYQSRRILLVEDNLINQKVALGLLSKLSYHADLATNGLEAVNAASSKRYDAILMDCEMPVMSGYEATRQIREREKNEKLARIPIIALTAHAAVGYQEKCKEVGMDDHLAKPVRLETLKTTLNRWLNTTEPDHQIKIY